MWWALLLSHASELLERRWTRRYPQGREERAHSSLAPGKGRELPSPLLFSYMLVLLILFVGED